MKTFYYILLSSLIFNFSFGQGFEKARRINYVNTTDSLNKEKKGLNFLFNSDDEKTKTDELGSGAEFFQQLGLNLTNTVPRISIKAVKLYAKVGKNKFIDFYILSSIPTISASPSDSIKNLGNELQSLYGGLLNSYFSKTWYFNKETDYQTRGLQIDLKGGYKLTESSKNSGTKNVYLHSGQLASEIRFLVPLFGNPNDTNLAGLTQIKLFGQALYNSSSDYDNFFISADGTKPNNFLYSSTIEGSVHIFNQFYISGGYSFCSIKTIDDLGYFKLTYSK
ncbi:hypothetical protein [Flavobacterium sp. UMI-01]|uniref:hypothetical protein n=1 Tax=Flavobacterium sp. UMI-01 TaxID=1441053 RepID=UPI001C7DD483|nr:hypothetical protein [Flavobacterium sp. UMI-01]GIZ10385.1 hypothetical protein FUMI01_31090 [Flavobacterium sp. UMI-01]